MPPIFDTVTTFRVWHEHQVHMTIHCASFGGSVIFSSYCYGSEASHIPANQILSLDFPANIRTVVCEAQADYRPFRLPFVVRKIGDVIVDFSKSQFQWM